MKKLLALLLCCVLLAGCAGSQTEPAQAEMVSYQLYYGDENGEKLLSKTAQANGISEQTVLFSLIGQGVLSEETEILKCDVKDGQVSLDFNDAFRSQLESMGTAGEQILIGSVVNTFLSAFDAETVLITVNGTTLETGHMVYDTPLEFME